MSNPALPSCFELAELLHELNQPLAAMLTNAQAAQRCLSGSSLHGHAELHEILADIVQDNKRAADVIRKMRQCLRDRAAEGRALEAASLEESKR